MSHELTTTHAPEPPATTTIPTIGELQERLAKAKEYLETALTPARLTGPWNQRHEGDYGVIPGCGDKPVLFKSGAEKLARLFNVEVQRLERTLMENVDVRHELLAEDDAPVAGKIVAYTCAIGGPDGRTWGAAEAFASHEETTFHEYAWQGSGDARRRTAFRGFAPINTLAARAQKRAYVRAVVQALGLTSLVSTHETAEAATLLTETQRDVIVALYEHSAPRMVDQIQRQATKIRANQWPAYLGSALSLTADVHEWSDRDLERATAALLDELATRDDVDALFIAEGELVQDGGES